MQRLPNSIDPASLGRLQLRMRRLLRSTRRFCQTLASASGGDVGGNSQIPRSTFPRRSAGLSQGDLLGTPLSASEREIAELALSYPHEFGEWA